VSFVVHCTSLEVWASAYNRWSWSCVTAGVLAPPTNKSGTSTPRVAVLVPGSRCCEINRPFRQVLFPGLMFHSRRAAKLTYPAEVLRRSFTTSPIKLTIPHLFQPHASQHTSFKPSERDLLVPTAREACHHTKYFLGNPLAHPAIVMLYYSRQGWLSPRYS
jgi:hypothetical protein